MKLKKLLNMMNGNNRVSVFVEYKTKDGKEMSEVIGGCLINEVLRFSLINRKVLQISPHSENQIVIVAKAHWRENENWLNDMLDRLDAWWNNY